MNTQVGKVILLSFVVLLLVAGQPSVENNSRIGVLYEFESPWNTIVMVEYIATVNAVVEPMVITSYSELSEPVFARWLYDNDTHYAEVIRGNGLIEYRSILTLVRGNEGWTALYKENVSTIRALAAPVQIIADILEVEFSFEGILSPD